MSSNAGMSARKRYDEGLRRWRAKVRVSLMLIIGPFVVAGLAIHFAAPASWEFYGGLLLGGGIAMATWAWDSPPAYVGNWKDGADGEKRTERALRRLEHDGWTAVHDLTARYGNRDHVAVGPAGTFLIDSKAPTGRVGIEGDFMCVSRLQDFDYRADLGGPARGAAAELHREIGGWVHAVVVIWGDFPDQVVEGDRVTFVAGGALADWLRSRPAQLSPERMTARADAVRRLQPA